MLALTYHQVMEKNGWTPTRLFHELGGASGETITKEKLEDKVRAVRLGIGPGIWYGLKLKAQGTAFSEPYLSYSHNQSYILVSNFDLYP